MQFNYSIIIPFRDNLKQLEKATRSIPDRSDIQIIVVDNSQTSLYEKYDNRHSFARLDYVTSDSAKGAGHARNIGLSKSLGKWLLFLDADDFFMESAFELFDDYLASDYDIVYFDITSCMVDTGGESDRHHAYNLKMNQFLESKNEVILRYAFPTPYCKLIRNELVMCYNIRFDEVKVSNDLMFSIRCGYYAKKLYADKRIAYCVTESPKNMSLTKQHNPDNWETRYRIAIDKYNFVKQAGHIEAAPSLYGYLIVALKDFGLKKFLHFFKIGLNNKVNFFIKFTNKNWIKDH